MPEQAIVVDFNRITRREFQEYLQARNAPEANKTDIDGALIEKVVVSWPYKQPVTLEGYMSLGLLDSREVDRVVSEAMGAIGQKN